METEKQEVASKKLTIAEAFVAIPDPRVAGRSKHDLVEMLVLAVCAMVCGVDDFVGIEAWGNERIDWLRRYPLPPPHMNRSANRFAANP